MFKWFFCLGLCGSLLLLFGCGSFDLKQAKGFLVYSKSNPPEILLQDEDILSYDAQMHFLSLTPEASKRLVSLEYPGVPRDVIFQLDGAVIFEAYLGDIRLISCVVQECYPGVFADMSQAMDGKLQLYYHSKDQSFSDPRDQPEFINHFKEL